MPNLTKLFTAVLALTLVIGAACHSGAPDAAAGGSADKDKAFAAFEDRFLDAYWKQHPSFSISVGYGKYYDDLTIPDSASFLANLDFDRRWTDSLKATGYDQLNDNNKISFKIIQNELDAENWYTSVFRQQEWDASGYNLSGDVDYILNQPYAPLDERLIILTRHLQHADAYFHAGLRNLNRPVKEYLELSILQNQGGLDLLGAGLTDSIKASHLSEASKDSLRVNVARTVTAVKWFVDSLKAIAANKQYVFRDFRIGKDLFTAKFKYDLATDLTPEEIYARATADEAVYHRRMFVLADSLWPSYFGHREKPKDSTGLIQQVVDKMQLKHASPAGFLDSVTNQLYQMKRFVLAKDLFTFDSTAYPIKVRLMPVYQRGIVVASAEQVPPYQKEVTAYYNVDDITKYDQKKAEGALREANNYASQLLTIHEAMPGHCLQLLYNGKKSADVLRSVFQNGPMVEGWAVYCEGMMWENGWGGHSPELELALDKWRLRELGNVIIDYGIQCLNMSEDSVMHFLVRDCFQTEAQAQEKWHRAKVSQAQLCFYYTGSTAIFALRAEYQQKLGSAYRLKDFHEKFLSFGSSPVKYIRERMLAN
jgi:Bacterial protein of unknown function (DUF885)